MVESPYRLVSGRKRLGDKQRLGELKRKGPVLKNGTFRPVVGDGVNQIIGDIWLNELPQSQFEIKSPEEAS